MYFAELFGRAFVIVVCCVGIVWFADTFGLPATACVIGAAAFYAGCRWAAFRCSVGGDR